MRPRSTASRSTVWSRALSAAFKLLLPVLGVVALLPWVRAWGQVYTYDLSSLPEYKPASPLVGMVRIHGSQLSLHLIDAWEEAFLAIHPDIRYRDNILPSWFSGLCLGTEDISVMGHEAWGPDLLAFQETFGYDPFGILFATGGFDQNRRGDTPGVVIMLNRDNPLQSLTLQQLDGIFGAARTGGWEGTHWSTAAA